MRWVEFREWQWVELRGVVVGGTRIVWLWVKLEGVWLWVGLDGCGCW